jgi:lipoyl(octanoyl) transferase
MSSSSSRKTPSARASAAAASDRGGEPVEAAVFPRVLELRRLGTVPYAEALELQDALVRERRAGAVPDTLLLLEHPHVITLGSDARAEHVLADEAERRLMGIELFETGRGGDVTYHGPGQLVGYPILDLKPDRKDLHRYLRDLEAALIDAAGALGVEAGRREGLTGVWAARGKLAAIGERVSSGWITSHGFALNVRTDLRYFGAIVPCGIRGVEATSVERELDRPIEMEAVVAAVTAAFAERFGLRVA